MSTVTEGPRSSGSLTGGGGVLMVAEEIDERTRNLVKWVMCSKCSKWRQLPPATNTALLPSTWQCKNHPYKRRRSCRRKQAPWNPADNYTYSAECQTSPLLTRMPMEILCRICRLLPMLSDQLVFASVCSLFRAAFVHSNTWKSMVLAEGEQFAPAFFTSDATRHVISKVQSVVCHSSQPASFYASISNTWPEVQWTSLCHLQLSSCTMGNVNAVVAAVGPQLKTASFANILEANDEEIDLASLGKCSHLQELCLDFEDGVQYAAPWSISGASFAVLSNMTALRSLTLDSISPEHSEVLDAIQSLPRLEHLTFGSCDLVDGTELQSILEKHPLLQRLRLHEGSFSCEDLRGALSVSPLSLRTFSLKHFALSCLCPDTGSCKRLPEMPSLSLFEWEPAVGVLKEQVVAEEQLLSRLFACRATTKAKASSGRAETTQGWVVSSTPLSRTRNKLSCSRAGAGND